MNLFSLKATLCSKMMNAPVFLFSVDLEDIRDIVPDGERYSERVPPMAQRYLEFLRRHDIRTTFFATGSVARKYPTLIRTIVDDGHEVACHSNRHLTLDKHSPESFRADLQENMRNLANAGVREICGFRAPSGSLTKATTWAYAILSELGFEYSSSVLPAKNPLFGWPEFGTDWKQMNGVWELPMTIFPIKRFSVPFCSGIYFRLLPLWLTRWGFRRAIRRRSAVVGYLHPHDIDADQERFMHPDIHDNRFYNFLMYLNRGRVLHKLERLIISENCSIVPYSKFVRQYLQDT